MAAPKSSKAAQTRQNIVDASMRLFERDGYDATTMRAIAAEAGVSLGNAYYYFSSKEHLIQAFYDQILQAHAEQTLARIAGRTAFAERLEQTMLAWIDVAVDAHEFAAQFFKNAADPASPLSPFSDESAGARAGSMELYRTVVEGSDLKLAPDLRRELPELLWLLQMGVVLFWVYDESPRQARSRTLVSHVAPLVDKVVRISRLPVVRGIVDDVLQLVITLRTHPSGPS